MIALVLCVVCQQDAFEQNFGKLADAWKAAGEQRGKDAAGLTDEYIRAMGKLSAAFEAAGLFDADAPAEMRAVKRLLVRRAESMRSGSAGQYANRARIIVRGAGGAWQTTEEGSSGGLERFEKSVAKQAELKAKGIDDEDNLQEVLVEQRKALKEMGVIADEMPLWIRRRIARLAQAVATGGAFPALAKATSEQEKRIAALVAQLGDSEPEKRDEAARELDKIGEPAVPALREAVKSGDAEVRERAKKILGVGLKLPETQSRAPDRMQALEDFDWAIEKFKEDKDK